MTPAIFPNKSLSSKSLFGIIIWNNSRKIESKTKYFIKKLILFDLLQAIIPTIDKIMKA